MRTIIVDGSNAVRGMYKIDGKPDFERETELSEELVSFLACLNIGGDCIIEVYFDGSKRYIYRPESVQIFFSARKKADDLIVNSVYEHSVQYSNSVLLITADRELISRSMEYGAEIRYTYDFLRDLYNAFPYRA